MAASITKEEALAKLRRLWFSFVVSIALYLWIGEIVPGSSWLAFDHAGKTFGILSVLDLLYFFWARRKFYRPAVELIRNQPEDIHGVRRWMVSWVMLLSAAEFEILFGLASRLGGKTLQQSLPFYVIGSLLILSLWPRQVWSSTKIAAQ